MPPKRQKSTNQGLKKNSATSSSQSLGHLDDKGTKTKRTIKTNPIKPLSMQTRSKTKNQPNTDDHKEEFEVSAVHPNNNKKDTKKETTVKSTNEKSPRGKSRAPPAQFAEAYRTVKDNQNANGIPGISITPRRTREVRKSSYSNPNPPAMYALESSKKAKAAKQSNSKVTPKQSNSARAKPSDKQVSNVKPSINEKYNVNHQNVGIKNQQEKKISEKKERNSQKNISKSSLAKENKIKVEQPQQEIENETEMKENQHKLIKDSIIMDKLNEKKINDLISEMDDNFKSIAEILKSDVFQGIEIPENLLTCDD